MIYTKTECKDATKGPPVLYEDSTLEKCKELCNQGLGVFILLFPCILTFFYCEGNLKKPPKLRHVQHLCSGIILMIPGILLIPIVVGCLHMATNASELNLNQNLTKKML